MNASLFHIGVKVFHVSCQSGQRVNCKCFCYFGADLPHHRQRCAEISHIALHDIADENGVIRGLYIGFFLMFQLVGFRDAHPHRDFLIFIIIIVFHDPCRCRWSRFRCIQVILIYHGTLYYSHYYRSQLGNSRFAFCSYAFLRENLILLLCVFDIN